MVDIEAALTYPMESEDWLKTVAIGGVMLIFSFLIVPMFVAYGYVARAIRANLDGEPEPPTFGDWGTLIVDGVKVWVVGFLYMLIPLIVMVLTVGTFFVAVLTGSEAGAAAGFGTLILGMLLTFVLVLVFGYFAVVAIVNMVSEDEFGAAFDVDVLRDVGLDGEFAIPWLIAVGVFLGVGVVTGFLNIIPFLGSLIGAFLYFYAFIVASRLWAEGFQAAT